MDLNICNLPRKNMAWFVALMLVGATAVAQTDSTSEKLNPTWGTSDSPTANAVAFNTALAPITSQITYTGAQFGSGGVGLRNRGSGGINISGVYGPVKAAYLYWAVITTGAATAPNTQMKIQRLSPAPVSAVTTIDGALVGTGGSPCWTGDTISVFRGIVPTNVATGNGVYQVFILPGAGGLTDGHDPWAGPNVLPLMEGASLVVIGTGPANATVALYDSGLAGSTFTGNPGLSYSLTLPVASAGIRTLLDSIGADGQTGGGRIAGPGVGDERTFVNGKRVAGPSSLYWDSDWNGTSSRPIPQLWDDVGHTITAATPAGTTTLDIVIVNRLEHHWDCLTPVANVVLEQ